MHKTAKKLDREALERVQEARTSLITNNGFFGFLAMQLRLVEATEIYGQKIDTMGVDGKNMFYNPKFVKGLTARELEGVVAHEVMHCAFSHFSRMGNRNPRIWNYAGDYVINADLLESGFTLPKERLFDPKYNGMSSEDVYEKLPKQEVAIIITNGKGDPGGCGQVLEAPGGQADKDDIQQTWETSVRMAIEVAKTNNPEHIPGSIRRLIGQLSKPKVSWRDKTRAFIDQSLSKETSWARPNRRSAGSGVLMPGYISDRLSHLVFIVDDSGSINMPMLTEFLSEVAGALYENVTDQLTVVYADTRVHHVDTYDSNDIVVPHELPNGGGGTAFSNSFIWVRENVPEASCVIYLTDLQVSDFGEAPECPVLWAVYAPDSLYEILASHAPFGTCIQVSNLIG